MLSLIESAPTYIDRVSYFHPLLKTFLANFHAKIDIFIIHRQSVNKTVTVFSILTKSGKLSSYLTNKINKIAC